MNFFRLSLLIIVTFFAALLRYLMDNIFIVSLIASLTYGFCLTIKINNYFLRNLVFVYFFSSFTTFSGFIPRLALLFTEGNYFIFFLRINLLVGQNIVFMYLGFLIGKRIFTKYNKTINNFFGKIYYD